MDKNKPGLTRHDLPQTSRGPKFLDQISDEDIRRADGLMLVDPQRTDWQQLVWSAPIEEGMMSSMTLRIVEIAVDSQDAGQVEAAKERVGQVKSGKPLDS